MKLLDLNTHSLEETNMEEKQKIFADVIAKEQPDIFALQEVNQHMAFPAVEKLPEGLVMVQREVPLRTDNHALALDKLLKERNLRYYWAWLPIKVGYDKYDEGVAIFSKKPILETENIRVSKTDDYHNYRTRRILGVRNEDGWFYDAHMSWWNDPDEPFIHQWETLKKALETKKDEKVFLMGDFNGDAAIRNENYDAISQDAFFDTYVLAAIKDDGFTVSGVIDGWRDQKEVPARRIDQIWTNQNLEVRTSKVIFNGNNYPVISDHFGIVIEL